MERWAVSLDSVAYSRHRHESYAIGVTRSGVQRFFYRGAHWTGLPGEWHVLHPDEIHDGMPGDGSGLGYRIFYLDPAAVLAAGPTGRLPFVADPLVRPDRVPASAVELLDGLDEPIEELREIELIADLAQLLTELSDGRRPRAEARPDQPAVGRVAALLQEEPERSHTGPELESLSGLSRWSLARQFRAAVGVSPSRYRLACRVRRAQQLILSGAGLAGAAAQAGFSDQAHLTRAFRSVQGITPGRWRTGVTAGH
ncbi:helix-turn-helix domain-containing protein [Microlunatus sp. GCM10028923]|uniref:helix-turn-helix domain-containing protein n=1 Tax=Microlunatus sp. GCM10028923 TaxID=3273400 RepID=UPI00361EEC29